MSLLTEVARGIRRHIFETLERKKQWRVLILDEGGTKVVSSCYKMHDLMELDITLVESIYKKRAPLELEAIYILYPKAKEIDLLIEDFTQPVPRYIAAHVFFLMACPPPLLQRISQSRCLSYLKSLVQLHLAFIPIESHVFSLELQQMSHIYSLPSEMADNRADKLEQMAEQLATLCATLGEYPRVCYRNTEANLELARLTQLRLDEYRRDNPSLGQGAHKEHSLLLISDRGVDPITPLVHELTLQAMSYDLLDIHNHTFTHGEGREIDMTDRDALWRSLRHQHIADVIRILPQKVRAFQESKKQFHAYQAANAEATKQAGAGEQGGVGSDAASLRDLSNMIKEMPHYQREAASYTNVYAVAEACMQRHRAGVDKLCELEQDLVMNETAQGETVRDPIGSLVSMFRCNTFNAEERLRLIMIFLLTTDGIAESHLDKLLSSADLDRSCKPFFAALCLVLGGKLIQRDGLAAISGTPSDLSGHITGLPCLNRLPQLPSADSNLQAFLPAKHKRPNRVDASSYALSRWTPYVQDIFEDAIQGKLDKRRFVFLVGPSSSDVRGLGIAGVPRSPDVSAVRGPSARFRPSAIRPVGGSSVEAQSGGSVAGTTSSYRSFTGDQAGGAGSMSDHCGPRLILYLVGGLTWSEARVAYKVTQKCLETRMQAMDRTGGISSGRGAPAQRSTSTLLGGGGVGWHWEVVVGGTHVITPDGFLNDLKAISEMLQNKQPTSEAIRPLSRGSSNLAFRDFAS